MVSQFLAHKPVNFTSLTDSFIVSFSELLKLWSWMQTRPTGKTTFRAQKSIGTFEKRAPDNLRNKQVILCPSHELSWFRVAVPKGSSEESELHYPEYIYQTGGLLWN